jgi:hypothetical protein
MSEDSKKSKPRADRVMRSADDGEIIADSKGRGKTPGKQRTDAGRKRIIAFIFWALAIIAEIIAIWTFNNFSVLWPSLAAIAADAVLCITAALFWKQANDMDPPKGKFLKNQLGVIMCLIAFLPIGYVLLKGSKDMPKSAKKVISVVAALAFVLTMGMSIDYNPTTQDDLTQAEQMALEYGGTAYWAKYSKSYHFDPDCQTLLNSKEIFQGTMEQAFELGKSDPCDFCAGGEAPASILESFISDEEE